MPRGRRRAAMLGLLVVLLTSAVVVLPSLAQKPDAPPAAAPAAVDPTLVVSASVASLDKVTAVAKEMGLAELPMLSASFVEQQMPFIGPGGLAADRPMGVLFYAGQQIDLEKSATFVLPVNPGKAELKSFVENGAQPVAGRTDLVTLEGVGFRRAKDQFVFGQIPDAVSAVREDVLTGVYATDAAALAQVDVDIAAFKRVMPDRYNAFMEGLDDGVEPGDAAQQAGADLVIGLMRELTRVGLSVGRVDGDGLRLSITAAPFDAVKDPAAKFARPGFPEGTIFRADLAHSPAKTFARVTDTFKTLIERDTDFAKLAPAAQEQVRTLASDVAKFVLGGDAGSIGVETVKDQVVVYWVTRHAAGAGPKRDVGQEIKALATRAGDVAKLTKQAKPFLAVESYPAAGGGAMVQRLVLLEDGKPGLYVDAVQRDGAVLMAITSVEGKFVDRLLALKDEGETSSLVSGWVDLSALAASGAFPAGADVGLDAQGVEELKNAMKGQRLEWTASPDAASGALRIDVNLPKSLVQNLPKLVAMFQ